MLYVIDITVGNIFDGANEKVYQRFFETADGAKRHFEELKKKVLKKGYKLAFKGRNYHFGDGLIWCNYDNEKYEEVDITLTDDFGTFYKRIDGKFRLSGLPGDGIWDDEETAKKEIFGSPKYTFDHFFK